MNEVYAINDIDKIIGYYKDEVERFTRYPNSDGAKQWAGGFAIKIDDLFVKFHSESNNEEEIIKKATKYLKAVFTSFVRSFADSSCHDQESFFFADDIVRIIWRAFFLHPMTSDTCGNKRGTTRLLNALVDSMFYFQINYVESFPDGFFAKVSTIPFYNLWGEEYADKVKGISSSLPLLTSEKEMIYIEDNRNLFINRLVDMVNVAVAKEESAPFFKDCSTIIALLEILFKDYVRRLRSNGIFDQSCTISSVSHWIDVTLSIIWQVYLRVSGEYVIPIILGDAKDPHLLRDIQDLSIQERRFYWFRSSLEVLERVRDDYISTIDNRGITPEWGDRLRNIGIDYVKLHEAMKDEYFSGITLDTFRQSFEFADFSQLYDSACKKKKKGAIQFMVSELGDNIGKDWLVQAAETVSAAKGAEAVREIRKGVINDPKREMRRLLRQWVANYRPRVKRTVSR